MGIGPVPATRKVLDRLGLDIPAIDVIELERGLRGPGAGGDCASSASPTTPRM
jgi:hypothetical protein